jgi:hypothetical protein
MVMNKLAVLEPHVHLLRRYAVSGEPIQEQIAFTTASGGFGKRKLFRCLSWAGAAPSFTAENTSAAGNATG